MYHHQCVPAEDIKNIGDSRSEHWLCGSCWTSPLELQELQELLTPDSEWNSLLIVNPTQYCSALRTIKLNVADIKRITIHYNQDTTDNNTEQLLHVLRALIVYTGEIQLICDSSYWNQNPVDSLVKGLEGSACKSLLFSGCVDTMKTLDTLVNLRGRRGYLQISSTSYEDFLRFNQRYGENLLIISLKFAFWIMMYV